MKTGNWGRVGDAINEKKLGYMDWTEATAPGTLP